MHVEALREFCLQLPNTSESFPFDEETLVFKVFDKMFALIPLERHPAQINLKCDPERSVELREMYPDQIYPGYHMSKKHWNTMLTEQLPPALAQELIQHSYDLVVAKLPKYRRAELK
jgi:predicted DNA-binding protein (MmcQ/YjbR family)